MATANSRISEYRTEALSFSGKDDDSPISITDDVFTPTTKDEVKCAIVFHSPTKALQQSMNKAQYSPAGSNFVYSPAMKKMLSSSRQSPSKQQNRSPRRRASTGENILNRSIPLKDATLLALATRGSGWGCQSETSPGGVVVDEESRMRILKGEFFTPRKEKPSQKKRSEQFTNGTDEENEVNLKQYAVSAEDQQLLNLAMRPTQLPPSQSGEGQISPSRPSRRSPLSSPLKKLSQSMYSMSTPTKSNRSMSFQSPDSGDITLDMTLQLIDAHQSPLRKAFLELADIATPSPLANKRHHAQQPSQPLNPQHQLQLQGASSQHNITVKNGSNHTANTCHQRVMEHSGKLLEGDQGNSSQYLSPPQSQGTTDSVAQWGAHTHNFSKDGWKENITYNSVFDCHKLLSENTFMEWEQIRDVVLQGALSEEIIRNEFRKSAATCAASLKQEGVYTMKFPISAYPSSSTTASGHPTSIVSVPATVTVEENIDSDYLYPKRSKTTKGTTVRSDAVLGEQLSLNKQQSVKQSLKQPVSAVPAIDMLEFSCLMARLELLYEEGWDENTDNEETTFTANGGSGGSGTQLQKHQTRRHSSISERSMDDINLSLDYSTYDLNMSDLGDDEDDGGRNGSCVYDNNDGSSIIDEIPEDVAEMYNSLISPHTSSGSQKCTDAHKDEVNGLSYVALMQWDKMKEAIESNFVSCKTIRRLYLQVIDERLATNERGNSLRRDSSVTCPTHPLDYGESTSTSQNALVKILRDHSLSLVEFNYFCALLQHSIDSPQEEQEQEQEKQFSNKQSESTNGRWMMFQSAYIRSAVPSLNDTLDVDEGSLISQLLLIENEEESSQQISTEKSEVAILSTTTAVTGVVVVGNDSYCSTSTKKLIENTSPVPACSPTTQQLDQSTTSIIVHSTVKHSPPSSSLPPTTTTPIPPVIVRTDLDTSVIGCNDMSMLSSADERNADASSFADDFNELTFLQTNTYLDDDGNVRTGAGVAMAGDLYKKDMHALGKLGPDVSILSASACSALWSKTFFALRGYMLTHFDAAKQKVVVADVRECKARATTTPKVLRRSEPEGFKFVIISRGKCMYLVASTEEERSLWIEKINEHMNRIKGNFLVL